MELTNLQILGLNKYESAIYLALVSHPGSTAAEISKYSQVPQNRVYDVVEQLISRRFAYLIPEDPKKYTSEDPKVIREFILEKKKEIDFLDKKFEKLEEEFRVINAQKVIVSRNKKNFDTIFSSIPKPQKFAYSIQPKLSLLPRHLKSAKEFGKANVEQKAFADFSMKDSVNLKKWKTIQPNFKLINTREIVLNINERGLLISLIPPRHESTIVYIENSDLGYLMKEMFESYWDSKK